MIDMKEIGPRIRLFERSLDQAVLPDLHIVARLDGRNFSRLTKETLNLEAPFDEKFRDMMADTVMALMDCGFRIIYGYMESDEISLLFHKDEDAFSRRVQKYASVLAGTASATLSLRLGIPAAFDCRILPLPTVQRVSEYFLWRQEDAARNAINAHSYWTLRRDGMNARQATAALENKSFADMNELLFQHGINFNDLPNWQKRGVGFSFKSIEKTGFNPVTRESVAVSRRSLQADYDLPLGPAYADFVEGIIRLNP